MATRKTKSKAARRASSRTSESKVTVDRGESVRDSKKSDGNFLDRIQNDLEKNQSYLNLILGALIVVVLGVLIFNYFNKPETETGNVTPQAQQTTIDEAGNVKKENLPGPYVVKEGDTLFTIAQNYYDDGYKYTEIIKENNLPGESIEVGQKLTIPKLETAMAAASAGPEASALPDASPGPETAMASPEASPEAVAEASPSPEADSGTGGAENQTVWGESIKGDTYTVQANDWLSKIAGRAYGDITKYDIIAKENNISNPDTIEVGTVLKIPRG
jgi:nucleoid-associated protein YgaU